MKHEFNLILMITKKNLNLLKTSVRYIIDNINPKCIYGVASQELREDVENLGIKFLSEDSIMDGLTFSNVKSYIENNGKEVGRTGWYFQQFLKLAFCYYSDTRYYVTWDSDTIPLNKIEYFSEDGKPCFIQKKEFHKPYFDTIGRLFNGKIYRNNKDVSYIAENMIFDSLYVKEMIEEILTNELIKGVTFFEKIINAVDNEDFKFSGFSEFETYGNYMEIRHPNVYLKMKMRTLRTGTWYFGLNPEEKQLEWASKVYDITSIEGNKSKFNFAKLTKYLANKNIGNLKTLVKITMPLRHLIDYLKGVEVINFD